MASTFWYDTFTAPDGTLLANHAPDIGTGTYAFVTGIQQIDGGVVHAGRTFGTNSHRAGPLGTVEYEVSAFIGNPGQDSLPFHFGGRRNTGASNGVEVRPNFLQERFDLLVWGHPGGQFPYPSFEYPWDGAPIEIRLRFEASRTRVWVDGQLAWDFSDYQENPTDGEWVYLHTTDGAALDNLLVTEVPSEALPDPFRPVNRRAVVPTKRAVRTVKLNVHKKTVEL